ATGTTYRSVIAGNRLERDVALPTRIGACAGRRIRTHITGIVEGRANAGTVSRVTSIAGFERSLTIASQVVRDGDAGIPTEVGRECARRNVRVGNRMRIVRGWRTVHTIRNITWRTKSFLPLRR